jgi:hypothetical protein
MRPMTDIYFLVIAGPDPAIHPDKDSVNGMDARVKPGHDEYKSSIRHRHGAQRQALAG